MRTLADNDAAAGVHRDQGADHVAAAGERRRRAETAFAIDGRGAETGSRGSQLECPARSRCGGVAEVTVGRKSPPSLFAAVEQIEERCRADDRHPDIPNGEAAAALVQISLHAGACVEPEGRPSRQNYGVDVLDAAVRLQEVGFTGSG